MSRRKAWQPYDAQGRRMPPPYAPRDAMPYEILDDGTVYDWDHEDLDYADRQYDGSLTRNEDAVVRAYVSGVALCDLAKATALPESIVGPIATAKWFLAVCYDRQGLSFERGRMMLSQAYPDAVRYLYEVMSGQPELDEHGEPERDDKGRLVRPSRADRMAAANSLLRLGPQAEAQGVMARRLEALNRSLRQESGQLLGLSAEDQMGELVRKYLPAGKVDG